MQATKGFLCFTPFIQLTDSSSNSNKQTNKWVTHHMFLYTSKNVNRNKSEWEEQGTTTYDEGKKEHTPHHIIIKHTHKKERDADAPYDDIWPLSFFMHYALPPSSFLILWYGMVYYLPLCVGIFCVSKAQWKEIYFKAHCSFLSSSILYNFH